MPTTVSSIFIFVALLMPGFVYRSAAPLCDRSSTPVVDFP